MKKKFSGQAKITARLVLLLSVMIGGSFFINEQLSVAQALDKKIQEESEFAARRVWQAQEVRQYNSAELPQIKSVQEKLRQALPPQTATLKALCLDEAGREGLTLNQFILEEPGEGANAFPFVSFSATTQDKDADAAASIEDKTIKVPIKIRGSGSYGSILRFADKVFSAKELVAIELFQIARSTTFQSQFGSVVTPRKIPTGESENSEAQEENPNDHDFYLEATLFYLPKEGGIDGRKK